MIAAGGYQHIRMFDLNSNDLNPVVNYGNISKNVMTVGFQVLDNWHWLKPKINIVNSRVSLCVIL